MIKSEELNGNLFLNIFNQIPTFSPNIEIHLKFK